MDFEVSSAICEEGRDENIVEGNNGRRENPKQEGGIDNQCKLLTALSIL